MSEANFQTNKELPWVSRLYFRVNIHAVYQSHLRSYRNNWRFLKVAVISALEQCSEAGAAEPIHYERFKNGLAF